MEVESQTATGTHWRQAFPPGTVRVEDKLGDHIVLSPQPSSDPNEPLNWSSGRKILHIILLCVYTVLVFSTLTVSSPLWQQQVAELGFTFSMLANATATTFAALSVGCVLFVPLALRLGRRPVYIITALIVFATAVWQAKMQTVGDLFGSAVLLGLAGAVNETLFQVTVADLFFVHHRGTLNGIYLVMVTIGNSLAPVASGYVAAHQGWRWSFWWCAILMGTTALLMVFLLEESKFDMSTLNGLIVLEQQHAVQPQAVKDKSTTQQSRPSIDFGDLKVPVFPDPTQQPGNRRLVEIDRDFPIKSYRQRHPFTISTGEFSNNRFMIHYYQPWVVLVTFPAVAFGALQYGFHIACLGILTVTQSTLYPAPPYNFSTVGVGNMSIAPTIGSVLGSIFGGPLADWLLLVTAKRNGGIYEPEMRLYLYIAPAISMGTGIFLYGLTISRGMPWIINAVGAGFIGFGLGGMGDMALAYIQDSHREILGDALVSVAFIRNAFATALVFAVPHWMAGMGVYNMFVLLGCLSLAVSATFIPMVIWGKKARAWRADRYDEFTRQQYRMAGE